MGRLNIGIRGPHTPVLPALAIACLGCAMWAGPASGEDLLEKGLRQFLDLKLPEALATFEAVASDERESDADRARASQYAARVMFVKSAPPHGEVRAAIRRMYEFDPAISVDVESAPTPFLRLCYEVSREMDILAVEAAARRETVLAIFDFDNASFDDKERWDAMGVGFAQMLVTDLLGVKDLQIVERQKLQFVLSELDLHHGDRVDPQTAAEAGKLLGAGTLMFGSFSAVGRDMRIDVRLVRTETGEVIKAGKITGRTDRFFELQGNLARLVVDEIIPGSRRTEELPPDFGSAQTKSLEAALAYSEGIRLMDEGMLSDAYERFAAAVDLSPDFQAARRRMQGLRPFLEG